MKHTPGPWKVIPKDSGFADVTISGPCPGLSNRSPVHAIATAHTYKNTTYPCFYEVTEEERDANARLIAAAPELLILLKDIIKDFNEHSLEQILT